MRRLTPMTMMAKATKQQAEKESNTHTTSFHIHIYVYIHILYTLKMNELRTRWAHRTERHFCAINTERLKFAFYTWILWHFLSIFALYIFPFWQNKSNTHTHRNNLAIQRHKERGTDRRNSYMQNCRFAWLRVWWLSVIVFLFLYSLSLSLLCYDNEICLKVAISLNMPPHFQLNIKSSISIFFLLLPIWVRSVRRKFNLLFFTWNSAKILWS